MPISSQEGARVPGKEAAPVTLPRFELPCDPALTERVRASIEQRGGLGRGLLNITHIEGQIILEGEVTRYYHRQIALACAQHVPGVRRVIDRIRVREHADGDDGGR